MPEVSARILEKDHEDVLSHLATYCSFPDGRQWADDVIHIVVARTRAVLEDAFDAFDAEKKEKAARSITSPQRGAVSALEDVTDDTFRSENAYIIEQLEACTTSPPHTIQRLAELLLQPCVGHTRRLRQDASSSDDASAAESEAEQRGALRGNVLQTAIRKCVLVSAMS